MSVIHKKETVCGCCGKLVQVDVIVSTSIFGYPDLDFRPPESKVQRDTVFLAPIEEDEDGFHLHLPGPKAPLDYF